MFEKILVQKALKHSWDMDISPGKFHTGYLDYQSSINSQLIHEIFGGEILKTHSKEGWRFYNRVNGERIDFTKQKMVKSFEDIPSSPEEAGNYFEREDYSIFFMRFVHAFENAVGLEKYQPEYSA